MNVLLSMPEDGTSNNYIINALHDLGHEVFFINHRINLKKAQELVPLFIEHNKIDLFLCLHLNPGSTYNSDYIKTIQARYPRIKYVAWFFDTIMEYKSPPEHKTFVDIIKSYDYFFTQVKGHVYEFRNRGVNAFFCPEGFDKYIPMYKDSVKKYDVSFVGQIGSSILHQEREALLEKVISVFDNTIIYGAVYGEGKSEELIKHHAKQSTLNDVHLSRVISKSKINLGFMAWPDLENGWSARLYRTMGLGGFFLTRNSKGLGDCFEIGKELDVYETDGECIEKIKYYLEHEEEREAIAKAGRERILKDYLFTHSLKRMMRVINAEQ